MILYLAALTEDGEWHLGLHDQTFVGWFTVVSYLVATALCLRCALTSEKIGPDLHTRRFQLFFWTLTMLTLFLGINKQLDLHHGLTHVIRGMAREGGWYEDRRYYQAWFVGGFSVLMIGFLGSMTWVMWGMLKRTMIAMTGLCLVLLWVMLRASSFHHVDHLTDLLRWLMVDWNVPRSVNAVLFYIATEQWIFEILGILLIIIGAMSNLIWGEQRRELRREDRLIHETRIATNQPTHAASAMLGDWDADGNRSMQQ